MNNQLKARRVEKQGEESWLQVAEKV